LGLKAFIKIRNFKKGVVLWCLWIECNEKVYKGQNYYDYKLRWMIMKGIVTYGKANGGIPFNFNLVLKHPPLKRSTRMILIDSSAPISLFVLGILVKCIGIINYENCLIFLNSCLWLLFWLGGGCSFHGLFTFFFFFAMNLFFHLFPKNEKKWCLTHSSQRQ